MGKQSGIGDRLYVGGYDLSGDAGSVERLETPRADYDVTGLNAAAHERILGLADVNISFNSFYNDAAQKAHPALSGLETTKRQVLYCRGSTVGQAALFFQAKQIGYDPTRGADGGLLMKVDINGSEGDPPEWGLLLTNAFTTFSTAVVTASRDDSAQSTAGLAAMLQVQRSSTGSLTITIEDSTDDALWTSLVAFTSPTSTEAQQGERVTVSGVVNRYLRMNTGGSLSSFSIAVATRRGSSFESVTY